MKEEKVKEKSYAIKVPVYTSAFIEHPSDLFGGVTYDLMISHIKKKIDDYNTGTNRVSKVRRNKVQKKVIGEVEYFDSKIGERPVALLKISAYNTNLHDGYVETDKKINLQQNNKLGSDNNFLLIFPNIVGLTTDNYKVQWLILIYEDPNKENYEIVETAKLVLKQILNISTANIKLPDVLEELKKMGNIPELFLRFTSISNDENEVDVKYRTYLVGSKLKKQRNENFKNMPFKDTEEIINDTSYKANYQKREVKISVGNKDYKISEAEENLNRTVEEIFNETIGITEKDMNEKLYSPDFIINTLTPVIHKYMSNNGKN